VSIELAQTPDLLNSCDCSMCFRLGTLWGYLDPADVAISGTTATFRRSDIEAWIDIHFCPGCGATINWAFIEQDRPPRKGVNMRLFGAEQLVGIPIRFSDGRNWNDKPNPPKERRDREIFAHHAPF
jgi:hypothetical protein